MFGDPVAIRRNLTNQIIKGQDGRAARILEIGARLIVLEDISTRVVYQAMLRDFVDQLKHLLPPCTTTSTC